MTHRFFDSSQQNQFSTAPTALKSVKAYNLNVRVNLVWGSLEAEVAASGEIVAVKYPSGISVRRHLHYVITQTNSDLWLADRWGGMHPID